MKTVDFFFDFLSPFSYFAWLNHRQVARDLPISFNYRPVLMGKIFSHWEIKGPGEIPPKRHYLLKACFRYAALKGFDFIPPERHPFNPLYALRLATISCAGEEQEKVIDTIWRLVWARGKTADDPERLLEWLNSQGLKGSELMEAAFSPGAKHELKNNTAEAIEKKVFGVPSFVLGEEVFWGNDSLETLKSFLSEGDSFDQELFQIRTKDIIL